MKKFLIVAAIVLAGGLGIWVSRNQPDPAPAPTPVAGPAVTAPETVVVEEQTGTLVDQATNAVTNAVQDAVDTATQAATDAVDAAQNTAGEAAAVAEDAAQATTEAAADAVEATEGAAISTMEAAEDTAGEAAAVVEDAAQATTEAAGDAVEATEGAATDATADTTVAPAPTAEESQASLSELFSADGFDYDQAVAAIEASDLGALPKATAQRALESARDNPELLPAVLEQIRGLLGL